MSEESQKLNELIQASDNILITSHTSPDPDALASVLLIGTTIIKNYPDKKVVIALEEEPIGLDFLDGYKGLGFKNLLEAVTEQHPDLFILLDGNNYNRASRSEGNKIRGFLSSNNVKTVVIDHHEPAGKEDKVDLYINQQTPATVQQVYWLLKQLDLEWPPGYAQTAMLGLYADSGGFAYLNENHSETFSMADELVAAGASIEKIKNALERYSESDLKILSELAANIAHDHNYSYSFMRDGFIKEWLDSGKEAAQIYKGTEGFINNIIRNIDNRKWGFIVYKNVLQGESIYSVSLRSLRGEADVSLIAGKLGGGGHKGAAGAKFEAASVEEAIEKVKSAIAMSD